VLPVDIITRKLSGLDERKKEMKIIIEKLTLAAKCILK
jgi:hypothetical protein